MQVLNQVLSVYFYINQISKNFDQNILLNAYYMPYGITNDMFICYS